MGNEEGQQATLLVIGSCISLVFVNIMYTLLLVPRYRYSFQKIHPTHAKFAIFFTNLIIFATPHLCMHISLAHPEPLVQK